MRSKHSWPSERSTRATRCAASIGRPWGAARRDRLATLATRPRGRDHHRALVGGPAQASLRGRRTRTPRGWSPTAPRSRGSWQSGAPRPAEVPTIAWSWCAGATGYPARCARATTTGPGGPARHAGARGLTEITFHSLRATWATLLADQGLPVSKLSVLLGHGDVQTTAIYIPGRGRTRGNRPPGRHARGTAGARL